MKNFYQIPDLNLGATILAVSGINLDSLDRSDPERIRFVFCREEGLDQLLESYWRKELRVEPISFAMAQKYLKNQIYNR